MKFIKLLHFRPIRAICKFAWDRAVAISKRRSYYSRPQLRHIFHFWCSVHYLLTPDRYIWEGDTYE